MKKVTSLCLAISLALGTAGTAQADRGRHDSYRQSQHDHRNHHNHGRRHGQSWVGPAAILAITGLAIGAAAYSQGNATPVYVAPAHTSPPYLVQAQPEPGSWYYCGSSGQYYPYVRYCNEGWQPVMPPPQ